MTSFLFYGWLKMREAKKRKEEEKELPGAGPPPESPQPGGPPPAGRLSAPDTPLDGPPPPGAGPRDNRPPIADPGPLEYPPERMAVSERGIPYHEERIHGDPYEPPAPGPPESYVPHSLLGCHMLSRAMLEAFVVSASAHSCSAWG